MIKLDDCDLVILKVLFVEVCIFKVDLVKCINFSLSFCWKCLEWFEWVGLIEGYKVQIFFKVVVLYVMVFVILEFIQYMVEYFQKFECVIFRCEDVIGCWVLGGGFDYLM